MKEREKDIPSIYTTNKNVKNLSHSKKMNMNNARKKESCIRGIMARQKQRE